MGLKKKLELMGLTLPEVSSPGGNYVSVNVRGNIAYVAIQFPIVNGVFHYQGRLGAELGTDDGYKAMQLCAVNVLSQVNKVLGLENLVGLNHLDAYYQASNGWDDGPIVANGASDLFVNVLAEKGLHTRAIFGVEKLPRNFCAGLTCSFTVLGTGTPA